LSSTLKDVPTGYCWDATSFSEVSQRRADATSFKRPDDISITIAVKRDHTRPQVILRWKEHPEAPTMEYKPTATRLWFFRDLEVSASLSATGGGGRTVSHICHNKDCLNPWHLLIEDSAENASRNFCQGPPRCGHRVRCAIAPPRVSSASAIIALSVDVEQATQVLCDEAPEESTMAERVAALIDWQREVLGVPEGLRVPPDTADPSYLTEVTARYSTMRRRVRSSSAAAGAGDGN